ncbi:MAG: FAD-binding oxidoreductase [Gemmatales bacterium]
MTIRPASVAELCHLVKDASATRQSLYPVGGRTQSHWLNAISKPGMTIEMTGINRLIDFASDDMTVTIETGMSMQALQNVLQEKRMWLPLDVPELDKATVGGSLAANVNGPRQTGYGTWRDYLLGLNWVNDQGEHVKAGGRVVKNVAGYDFCKLMIGSFGTLGIITQVTLKVKPLPEATSVATGAIPDTNIKSWSHRLLGSGLRPTVCVLSKNITDDWTVTIGFEESKAAVEWQVTMLMQKILPDATILQDHVARQQLDDFATKLQYKAELSFLAQLPRGQGAAFTLRVAPHASGLCYQPYTGIVTGTLIVTNLAEATQRVNTLRQYTHEHGGWLLLPACPPDWRHNLQPFGAPRCDWNLMRHVKRTLDPQNLFQPERFEVLHGE